MAAEVGQVAAQERTAQDQGAAPAAPAAPYVSSATAEPAMSPLPRETEVGRAKPVEGQPAAVSTGSAKLDNPPAEAVPVGTLANGNKLDIAPREPPTMTGALPDARPKPDAPASAAGVPSPADLPAAPAVHQPKPADDGVKGAAASLEKPAEETPAAVAPLTTDAVVADKANGGAATTAPAAEAPKPEAAPAPETGAEPIEKRKAEEQAETDGNAAPKKARTEAAGGETASNGTVGPRKSQRSKKQREPAPVGRTERKTRSQGPA